MMTKKFQCSWSLAMLLAVGGCGGGTVVNLSVSGDRAGGASLVVLPELDGTAGKIRTFPTNTQQINLFFDPSPQATLELSAATFDDDSCILASGTTQAQLSGQAEVNLRVSLVALSVPYCGEPE